MEHLNNHTDNFPLPSEQSAIKPCWLEILSGTLCLQDQLPLKGAKQD